MIINKEIKIKIPKEFSSGYIEENLKQMGLDVLKWAITDFDKENYTLNVAVVID